MMLLDTNILINAHRQDADRHTEYREWLQALVNGPAPYAVSDHAVTGMIRIVTNPRIFQPPAMISEALVFASAIRNQPHAQVVSPGPRFWDVFTSLCGEAKVTGDLVPDAYLAALAIEHGCEFITADKGFGRYPGLRWRHPLN